MSGWVALTEMKILRRFSVPGRTSLSAFSKEERDLRVKRGVMIRALLALGRIREEVGAPHLGELDDLSASSSVSSAFLF